MFPLRAPLAPLLVFIPVIRIRYVRAVSVAEGEGGLVPGGVVLEDPEAGQVLRDDARPDVDHRVVVKVHFAERTEVPEIFVQRIVQLLALVERLEVLSADARLARLFHHVLDVDPEEMVDVHVPVQVGHDRVLEPEGDLTIAEVAVGEVEPRAWWDVPREYDLQGVGCRPCSEPRCTGGVNI